MTIEKRLLSIVLIMVMALTLVPMFSVESYAGTGSDPDYLTFTANNKAKIKLRAVGTPSSISFEYATKSAMATSYGGFQTYIIDKYITLTSGESIQFRASESYDSFSCDSKNYYQFVMSGDSDATFSASGNVMSLLSSSCAITTASDFCFYRLFYNCSKLTQAPELPALSLGESCYNSMFKKCSALTSAPALNAEDLDDYCYFEMFSGCTSLTEAPVLPATNLAKYCYCQMFSGCTSLTEAPELPASKLMTRCYRKMFDGCTSLTTIASINHVTELGEGCCYQMYQDCRNVTVVTSSMGGIYHRWKATNASNVECWSEGMFNNTSGSSVTSPGIKTIYYTNNSGDKTYHINIAPYDNGTVSSSPSDCACFGDTVELTLHSNEEYALEYLDVVNTSGKSIYDSGNAFTMPASDVTVSAIFAPAICKIGEVPYASVQTAIDSAETDDTILLTTDVSIKSSLVIAKGQRITIDLNGHTIKQMTYASIITNKGTLIIKDDSNQGCITGGNSDNGGGIYNQGNLTVSGISITSNTAVYGGGIYNEGTLTVSGGSITSNSAVYGGGIYNKDNLTVNSVTISHNKAENNNGNAYGGGILNKKKLIITGSYINYNSSSGSAASYGGGIHNSGDEMRISNSIIKTNTAYSSTAKTAVGGGIYIISSKLDKPTTIVDSTIEGNKAIVDANVAGLSTAYGGGIAINACELFLSGNTYITSNFAVNASPKNGTYERQAFGGGVCGISTATISILNEGVNIVGNVADASAYDNEYNIIQGGGIYAGSKTTLIMTAGAITNNIVKDYSNTNNNNQGGGIIVTYGTTKFTVGGTAKICDNYAITEEISCEAIANNVFLRFDNATSTDAIINVGTDDNAPTTGMSIGVTRESGAGFITTSCGCSASSILTYFTSDDSNYDISSNSDDSALVLAKKNTDEEKIVIPIHVPVESSAGKAVTVPVSQSNSETATAQVSASVSGSTATVSITDAELAAIAKNGVTESGNPTGLSIDISSLDSNVSEIEMKTETFKELLEIIEDKTNDYNYIEIKFPNTKIALYEDTVKALADQSMGSDVKLVIDTDEKAEKSMNTTQKTIADGMNSPAVFDAYFVSGGKRITDFKGGTAAITGEYETTKPVRVWYVNENGEKELCDSVYDGKVCTFVIKHFSHYIVEEAEAGFVDVEPTAYYYNAVSWAVEKGITDGVDATHFNPSGITTRAQMVTFLWRAAGSPVVNYAMPFTDVPEGEYYTEAVRWAVSLGITNGTSETTFSPYDNVTRGQTVAFLWRYEGSEAQTSVNPFIDVLADRYYYNAVLWAKNNKVTDGTSANKFSPDDPCTRGQIVTFLYRSEN